MKKKIALVLSAAMAVMSLAGCGSEKESLSAATTQESGNSQTEVVVWHDGNDAIMEILEDGVNEALNSEGISVKFERKTGLTDQMKLYGNDEANGPDMYLYAHDSLGTFAEMGILAPITDVLDESDYADMLPMTLRAGVYKDTQYLLPVYFETLLFLYNKDLWQGEVPSTTEELYEYMESNTDTSAGTYALVNQHSTAYNVAPFINGFGGYIINEQSKPGLDDEKTIEAIEYNKKFAALEADGDYNTVTTLFNEGKAAAIIGGPWLISGIKEAEINLGIKSLSDFTLPNGNALSPYSGVQGIGVMKYAAENKKDALGKVLREIAKPQIGIELALESGCAPANQISYDYTEVAKDEMIVAMKRTAETAQPMPNVPEMSVMWGPSESLLAAVNKSGQDVQEAAKEYQAQAETAISDMQ
ncbi:extracellular solute-binding protein [Konateibacter massiliensis]|uniref:extracellular solute-binding protein n=1 Tax=Konateibacter massiliensis TaxID=2002841 RepID=UPI000C157BC6|nr:extracellular solute-binding protein [Konateibacter massiliensis]